MSKRKKAKWENGEKKIIMEEIIMKQGDDNDDV